jgi:hypothetical protein
VPSGNCSRQVEYGFHVHPVRLAVVYLATALDGVSDWSDRSGRIGANVLQTGKHQQLSKSPEADLQFAHSISRCVLPDMPGGLGKALSSTEVIGKHSPGYVARGELLSPPRQP